MKKLLLVLQFFLCACFLYAQGDLDGDGEITVRDLALLNAHLQEVDPLGSDQLALADIDLSGSVDIADRDRMVDLILYRDISIYLPAPDLLTEAGAVPSEVLIGETFQTEVFLQNDGGAVVPGSIPLRVYLSSDQVAGNGDDILLSTQVVDLRIEPGQTVTARLDLVAPSQEGDFRLVVEVGAQDLVASEAPADRFAIGDSVFRVSAPYTATVGTASSQVFVDQPVRFVGRATLRSGSPAASVPVMVSFSFAGAIRERQAVTDNEGYFQVDTSFGVADIGQVSVSARHPAAAVGGSADLFTVNGLEISLSGTPLTLFAGEAGTLSGTLGNLGSVQVSGLTASIPGLPGEIAVSASFPQGSSVPVGGEIPFEITLETPADFSGSGQPRLFFESAAGLRQSVGFDLSVTRRAPYLVSGSSTIPEVGIMLNSSKTLTLSVINEGSEATGPINVFLPNLPWLSLGLETPLPSLAPGASFDLPLMLQPGADVAIGVFSPSVVLQAENGNTLELPFTVRTVTDLVGDIEIAVEDELTYFTQGEAPLVAGARVRLRNPIDQQVVVEGETSAGGLFNATNLPEGSYVVEVSSPHHIRTRQAVEIVSGRLNREAIFISQNFVSYDFSVVERAIEDTYQITVTSRFETNIPAPVLVVTPGIVDVEDLTEIGNFKVIEFTITNVGLIEATAAQLVFPSGTYYDFHSTRDDSFVVPAKSSITIPVVVERIGASSLTVSGTGSGSGAGNGGAAEDGSTGQTVGGNCAPAVLRYQYDCGRIVTRTVPIPLNGADCGQDEPLPQPPTSTSTTPGEDADPIDRPPYTPSPTTTYPPLYWDTGGSLGVSGSPAGGGPAGGYAPYTLSLPDDDCSGAVPGWVPPLRNSGSSLSGIAEYVTAVEDANCLVDVLNAAAPDFPALGSLVDCLCSAADCAAIVTVAEIFESGPALFSSATLSAFASFDEAFANAAAQLDAHLKVFVYLYGDTDSLMEVFAPEAAEWHRLLRLASLSASPSGRLIDADERASLAAEALASGLDQSLLAGVVDRWATSAELYAQGIDDLSSVPAGLEDLYIDQSTLIQLADQSLLAAEAASAAGYLSPQEQFVAHSSRTIDALTDPASGICAQVVMQVEQELVLTRTAFEAKLALTNNSPADAMQMVAFDFDVRDTSGTPANDRFAIEVDQLQNLTTIDGTGDIAGGASATITWLLIPNEDAAPTASVAYEIGGTISFLYRGELLEIDVVPASITVQPDAALELKYFHQRDVYSDDPFTAVIEPAEPFALAVMVNNTGAGAARNLTIESAQPEIIENDKGLLIDFKILSSSVNGAPAQPTLKADFGELAAGEIGIATWNLEASLQGLFVDYEASFTHESGNGDPRLSLIKSVEIHETIRQFEALAPFEDGLPDFFVNGVNDVRDLGDSIHFSDGSISPVTLVEALTLDSQTTESGLLVAEVSFTAAADAWHYLRAADPFGGTHRLVGAFRADGTPLPVDQNIWQSDRTFVGLGQRPVEEDVLHLLDYSQNGPYTLHYELIPVPDTTPPSSSTVIRGVRNGSAILLEWSGTDDGTVARYDVFVSENDGDYFLWLEGTTSTSALFEGVPGSSYTFYTVATDAAGNRQPATPESAAAVEVAANRAPQFEPVGALQASEGRTFYKRLVAIDPDGDSSALRYRLVGVYPRGLTLDARSGWLSWTPFEGEGGQTINVVAEAIDGAVPAGVGQVTFTIAVAADNQPPRWGSFTAPSARVGELFVAQPEATDPDLPAQTLTYSLAAGAPDGMTIDPATGRIEWVPDTALGNTTAGVTVRVSDSGTPALSAELTFVFPIIGDDSTETLEALDAPLRQPIAGLVYSLFEGAWSSTPDFANLFAVERGFTPNVDLQVSPSDGSRFLLVFDGFIEAPESGRYTFFATSNALFGLTLGGRELLETTSEGTKIVSVQLEAGLHTFEARLLQSDTATNATLALEWERLGVPRHVIPETAFFYDFAAITDDVATAEVDRDLDGVPDSREAELGLDPQNPDSDGNGVRDGEEDFDGDTLPNAVEIYAGLNPAEADSDGNGIGDEAEDVDGDGLLLIEELAAGTDPLNPDTDGDLWNDETEITSGSDPLDATETPLHLTALFLDRRVSTDPVGAYRASHRVSAYTGSAAVLMQPRLTVDPTTAGGGIAQPPVQVNTDTDEGPGFF